MIRVKVEFWMWIGKELGEDANSPSEMRSELDLTLERDTTLRAFMSDLAKQYKAIDERIFDSGKGTFYSDIVVTLNDRVVGPTIYNHVLQDADRLLILPAYAGG